MAELIHCDICGKMFSSRHLKSHKRLAHPSNKVAAFPADEDTVKTILHLYESLSVENRERVLAKLAALK